MLMCVFHVHFYFCVYLHFLMCISIFVMCRICMFSFCAHINVGIFIFFFLLHVNGLCVVDMKINNGGENVHD
jgi:hypothetical protein